MNSHGSCSFFSCHCIVHLLLSSENTLHCSPGSLEQTPSVHSFFRSECTERKLRHCASGRWIFVRRFDSSYHYSSPGTSSVVQLVSTFGAKLWDRFINAHQRIKRCHISSAARTKQLFILVINNDLVFRIFAQKISSGLLLTPGNPPPR